MTETKKALKIIEKAVGTKLKKVKPTEVMALKYKCFFTLNEEYNNKVVSQSSVIANMDELCGILLGGNPDRF